METKLEREFDIATGWILAIVVMPVGAPLLFAYYNRENWPAFGELIRKFYGFVWRYVFFIVWYPIKDHYEVKAGRWKGYWRIPYAALFLISLPAGLARTADTIDFTFRLVFILAAAVGLIAWAAAPFRKRRQARRAALAAQQAAERRARQAREAALSAERERQAQLEQSRNERVRAEAEARRLELEHQEREAKRLQDEQSEAERLKRDQEALALAERAKRERPAMREALLLLYAQHAPLIAGQFSANELGHLLQTELSDARSLPDCLAAKTAIDARIRRLVAREQIRRVYEANEEFVGQNFSPLMFDLYLRDSMGDHRPVEDVEEAGDRLTEMLLRFSETSTIRRQREQEEAERRRRASDSDLAERLRAEGVPEDLIEIELAERRAATFS